MARSSRYLGNGLVTFGCVKGTPGDYGDVALHGGVTLLVIKVSGQL